MKKIFLLTTLLFSVSCNAEKVNVTDTQYSNSSIEKTKIEEAKLLDISTTEYDRYKTIMKGFRGKWTPNLDPITVLGINARTESERKKYAEKLVHIERERTNREILFEKAYQDAQKRLYGDIPLYVIKPKAPIVTGYGEAKNIEKIDYFMTIPCEDCANFLNGWINNNVKVDAYFVGVEEQVIKKWIKDKNISEKHLKNGTLTLSMGNIEAKQRGITKFPYMIEYIKK